MYGRGILLSQRLASGAEPANLSSMKFILATAVYLLMGLVLAWGILLMMGGNPWLLIVAGLAYLIAFSKIGCASH